jgi:vacuole membrane protein 1
MQGAIDKQKKTLFAETVTEEARPLIAIIWEYFVMLMIAYFVYSIINSLVQNYLNEEQYGSSTTENENKKKKK